MSVRSIPIKRRLVFLGPPGAGKGTQADHVENDFGLAHISTGELFREAVRRGDELGRQAQRFMEKGQLVPDEIVIQLVERTVLGLGDDPGFVLDGVPRTLRQARELSDFFARYQIPFQAVILFDVDEELIVKRLSGRRQCPTCGRIYNIYFSPPRTPDICDDDGTPLVRRPDDDPQVIRKRLQVYRTESAPVLEFFQEADLLERLDAGRSTEEVYNDLIHLLTEDGHPKSGAKRE